MLTAFSLCEVVLPFINLNDFNVHMSCLDRDSTSPKPVEGMKHIGNKSISFVGDGVKV